MKRVIKRYSLLFLLFFTLLNVSNEMVSQASSHYYSPVGLFDRKTQFSLSSETGVLPALEIETKDVYGDIATHESDSGELVISENNKKRIVKRAILKGQTLMNLLDEPTTRWPFISYDRTSNTATFTNPYDAGNIGFGMSSVLKPSTKYIFKMSLQADNNWLTNEAKHIAFDLFPDNYQEFAHYLLSDTQKHENYQIFTSPATIPSDLLFRVYVSSKRNGTVVVSNLTLMEYKEGMENWDITFFKGSQSVVNPVLTISNEDNSQTAIVSIEGNITLRSNGDIYDELDLMTGKLTQRIGENGNVLNQEIIRYVKINSTHHFSLPNEGDVSVVGSIIPTIVSINVPSEALSFTLNPNLEVGQQFIASDFSISNNSQAPIKLGIQSFEQTTTLLNDVLPDKYDSWVGLNKTQSKDIALALEPQPSNSWISLNQGSYYVANTSSVELGQIKGNSSVNFKFSALHGQAFAEPLNPQYRLTFVFEL